MELLVVSGLSGGGKSTALHALEDLGVYCVDNVPVPLVPQLVEVLRASEPVRRRVAVGVDARDVEHLAQLPGVLDRLREQGLSVQVAFFEADNVVLVRRYSETRRMHPMGQHELPEAIVRERELLASIRERADVVIDTSNLVSRQLGQLVRDRWGGTGGLRVALVSFAYRGGLPPEADLVLDARILANPNDVPSLRPMTGLHEPVARYVTEQADAQTLLEHAERLVRFMASRMQAEGRAYFAVAVGCTGGQHRSVAIVEALKRRLEGGETAPWTRMFVRHRDVGGAGS
jgi:UPF0042 nucleotide-binding protein